MGNCFCLCPCLERFIGRGGYCSLDDNDKSAHRRVITQAQKEEEEEELIAMKIPPVLPKQFSKLYSIGDLLGSGTTSRVFRVFRRKQATAPGRGRPRLSSSEIAILEKQSSRYNLVDDSTHQFLIDSSDDDDNNNNNYGLNASIDVVESKKDFSLSYQQGPPHLYSPSYKHNIEDYEPVVEKSMFVTATSSVPLACKIIDKKKLALGIEDNEFVLFQLRKEIDILRRINHSNIVKYYDYTETKNHIMIITECLAGGELFDHLAKNGPLSENSAKQAFFGLFSAVAYLHDRGVIHRDIKAENVILCQHNHNGGMSMKLIDFGFSTIAKYTMTESFLGTGGYIAPEIRQHKSYSTSVDDWALGVLVYCSLSARLPFGTSIELLPPTTQQCEDLFKLRFPTQFWGGVSEECKDFISSLLRVDPMLRMTAKHSLSHPWFASVVRAKLHASKPGSNLLQRKYMHPELHNCTGIQFLELTQLHSSLRQVRSTLELERKSRRRRRPQPPFDQKKNDSSESANTDGTSSHITVTPIVSPTTSELNLRAAEGVEHQLLTDTDTGTTTTTGTSSNSNSNSGSHNHLNEASEVTNKLFTDSLESHGLRKPTSFGLFGKKKLTNAFIWDELHDKNAGNLFFSTYMPSYSTYT